MREADLAEYNRQTDFEWSSIRDFLILHYHANGRAGALWRECREMEVPESLAHKIALFQASGRLFRVEEELFTEQGWLQVMLGQGIEPEAWHPLADEISPAQLAEFLSLTRRHAAQVAGAMPPHSDYIARHCASAAAAA
jgi:tryptophan halogenase